MTADHFPDALRLWHLITRLAGCFTRDCAATKGLKTVAAMVAAAARRLTELKMRARSFGPPGFIDRLRIANLRSSNTREVRHPMLL